MRWYLNNCKCRPHAAIYGSGAIYDLNLTGVQANMARTIRQGDECVVASYDDEGNVVFDWFRFTREALKANPTNNGIVLRVFYGKPLRSETLQKSVAAKTAPYSVFFNVLGHFKYPSVIMPPKR